MTNANIILNERLRLLEAGLIKSTGQLITIERDGLTEQVPMPEEMHTFQTWRERFNRQVNAGEHGHEVRLWKMNGRKRNNSSNDLQKDNEDSDSDSFFLHKTFLFAKSQTSEILS